LDLLQLVFIKGTVPFFLLFNFKFLLFNFYFLLFVESFALYVVSAKEELFALPGAADGGKMPLLAAESGPPEPAVVSLLLGVA
jgi:hypothetical protein